MLNGELLDDVHHKVPASVANEAVVGQVDGIDNDVVVRDVMLEDILTKPEHLHARSLVVIAQAVVLLRIKGGRIAHDQLARHRKVSLRDQAEALHHLRELDVEPLGELLARRPARAEAQWQLLSSVGATEQVATTVAQ